MTKLDPTKLNSVRNSIFIYITF